MQRFITVVVCSCMVVFLLPIFVAESGSVTPRKNLSLSLHWQGKVVQENSEISTQLNTQGTTTVGFSLSNTRLQNFLGTVATSTDVIVDIYKGDYQSADLYQSYSYTHDGSSTQFALSWDEPGNYFISVYAKHGEKLSESKQTDLYNKMRPFFQSGDTSGFNTETPVQTRIFTKRAYAQSSTSGILLWGKKEFKVVESEPKYSSVAFIPGFQASRLYTQPPDTDRLWEPGHNGDLRKMMFTDGGESKKVIEVGSAIRSVKYGPFDSGSAIYDGFFAFLDKLTSDETIAGWQPLPYDWRRRQDNVVQSIVAGKATSSTYNMVSRIEDLASNSDTGKVTLVGHSNGGLIGKLLISELADRKQNGGDLIDKFIMVGTPQVGTPKAVGALLHGLGQQYLGGLVAKKQTARMLAKNMPGMYGLLPSPAYFKEVKTPVIEFSSGESTEKFRDRYDKDIDSYQEFRGFLTGKEGRLAASGINQPLKANTDRLSDYQTLYTKLSQWKAPTSTEVTQIVGWGLPTVKGLRYFDKEVFCLQEIVGSKCGSELGVKPLFTKEGDKTVVQPSSNYADVTEKVFLNIRGINDAIDMAYEHSNMTEILETQHVIESVIKNDSINFSSNILDSLPKKKNKKLMLLNVHSPVDIKVREKSNTTGLIETKNGLKQIKEDISGSRYIEFGESKYTVLPKGGGYDIQLFGTGSGAATIEVDELDSSGKVTASSTFSSVSVTTSTKAEMNLVADDVGSTTLSVDQDGDGTIDNTIKTNKKRQLQPNKSSQDTAGSSGGGGSGKLLSRSVKSGEGQAGVVLGRQDLTTSTTDSPSSTTSKSSATSAQPADSNAEDALVMQMNQDQLIQLLNDLRIRLRAILRML